MGCIELVKSTVSMKVLIRLCSTVKLAICNNSKVILLPAGFEIYKVK